MSSNATFISVALVGYPNAGKSTLFNGLLNLPLAATSQAAGTTRKRIIGLTRHEDQGKRTLIQWIDSPGFFTGVKWSQILERRLHAEAVDIMGESDAVILVLDATRRPQEIEQQIQDCKNRIKFPAMVILNKIDRIKDKNRMLPLFMPIQRAFPQTIIVPVSGLRRDGLERIVSVLLNEVVPAIGVELSQEDWVQTEDQFTQNTLREISHDWLRGALLEGLYKEVPMETDVLIDSFQESSKDITIHANVIVERNSQKGIIIGEDASRLKRAGQRAREILSDLFDKPVHVMYHVQVREDWSRKEGILHELGY